MAAQPLVDYRLEQLSTSLPLSFLVLVTSLVAVRVVCAYSEVLPLAPNSGSVVQSVVCVPSVRIVTCENCFTLDGATVIPAQLLRTRLRTVLYLETTQLNILRVGICERSPEVLVLCYLLGIGTGMVLHRCMRPKQKHVSSFSILQGQPPHCRTRTPQLEPSVRLLKASFMKLARNTPYTRTVLQYAAYTESRVPDGF